MLVGSLGNIVFTVSPNKIETLTNIKQSGSAAYSEHKRHSGNTLLEFTGINAESISFEMTLSADLGVDVDAEIDKIVSAERTGKILSLIIGKKMYGRYKWVIKSHSISMKYFDKENKLVLAVVSVSLGEYCER